MMKKKKFFSRTLTVIVSLPLLFGFFFLLPQYEHLACNLVVVAATFLAAFEAEALFRKKKIPTARYMAPLLAGSLSLATYFEISGLLWSQVTLHWTLGSIVLLLGRACFVRTRRELVPALPLVSSSTFIVLYPGLLMSFIVRLSSLPDASFMLLLFFSLVFGNDMLAYLAGTLLGRGRHLGITASPKKTLVGFVVGFGGSIGIAVLFYALYPELFAHQLGWAFGIGALMGVTTNVGDLFESALKRSATVKDSGTIIPGRGGLLDCVDSMLVSAPVFYYIFDRLLPSRLLPS